MGMRPKEPPPSLDVRRKALRRPGVLRTRGLPSSTPILSAEAMRPTPCGKCGFLGVPPPEAERPSGLDDIVIASKLVIAYSMARPLIPTDSTGAPQSLFFLVACAPRTLAGTSVAPRTLAAPHGRLLSRSVAEALRRPSKEFEE